MLTQTAAGTRAGTTRNNHDGIKFSGEMLKLTRDTGGRSGTVTVCGLTLGGPADSPS